MDVFCVGMYRSGSTWQYEVVSHLMEQHRQGRRLGFVTGAQYTPQDGSDWRCLKAHEGHDRFAAALAAGRARAVYVSRDLRDVAFSLAHVYRSTFEDIVERQRYLHLCLANDDYWSRQPGVLTQRYEQLTADPAGAIEAIAAHLDVPLAATEAAAIAGQYSVDANRQRAAAWEQTVRARGINPDDPAHGLLPEQHSLLHWNHIRTGQMGGWQEQATARQRVQLAVICGSWLKTHGYERDDAWVVEGLAVIDRMADELQSLQSERSERIARQTRTDSALRLTEDRLLELERLGPVALRLAALFHEVSVRWPRLREVCRRLLGLGRERAPEPITAAGWSL